MKIGSLKIEVLGIVLLSFMLTACWEQNDVLTIAGNGDIEVESKIEITDDSFSYEEIQEISDEFISHLTKGGWTIEKQWKSEKKPYQMLIIGSGNIHKITDRSDFYELKKTSDNVYEVVFEPAENDGGKSSRSMQFKNRLIKSDAEISDKQGKRVTKIGNVSGKNVYTISLE